MFLIFRTGRSVRLARYKYRPEHRPSLKEHVATLPKDVVQFPAGAHLWTEAERVQFERDVLAPNRAAARAFPRLSSLLAAAAAEVQCGHVSDHEAAGALLAARSFIKALEKSAKR